MHFGIETGHFRKVVLSMELFLSLQFFTFLIVNIRVWKYVFTHVVIKIKIFYSCRSRVVRVALVPYLCHTRVTLVLQSCLTLVALVSHSFCILVARVALLWLVSGPRVVNQTRSDTLPKNNSNDAFISNDVNDVESTMSHDEITIHCNSNSNGITHAIAVAINEESKINNISKVTTLNYLIKDC